MRRSHGRWQFWCGIPLEEADARRRYWPCLLTRFVLAASMSTSQPSLRRPGHEVALIDHDLLTEPDGAETAVARFSQGDRTAVYHGWMISSGQYAALAAAPTARGVTLRTRASQYQKAHELPGW